MLSHGSHALPGGASHLGRFGTSTYIMLVCRMETVRPEDGGRSFCRPVVRIPELGLIFTRIIADKPHTSMVMHVRPGWTSLYDSLCPAGSPEGLTG